MRLLLLLLLLQGCTPEPADPIRLGTNIWPGYEPLYLARSLGWLEQPAVRLLEFPSSTEVIRAMRDHALEAAALTLDEALVLAEGEPDIRIVLVMDVSNGADAVLVQSAIDSPAALKGARIGAETTALGAYMVTRLLDRTGLSAKDVVLKPLPVNEHLDAFMQGRVDAVVTFDPVRSALLAHGARTLFDSSDIPGEIVDVLVVRQALIERQPQQLRLLMRQWFRALDHIRAEPADSAARM